MTKQDWRNYCISGYDVTATAWMSVQSRQCTNHNHKCRNAEQQEYRGGPVLDWDYRRDSGYNSCNAYKSKGYAEITRWTPPHADTRGKSACRSARPCSGHQMTSLYWKPQSPFLRPICQTRRLHTPRITYLTVLRSLPPLQVSVAHLR